MAPIQLSSLVLKYQAHPLRPLLSAHHLTNPSANYLLMQISTIPILHCLKSSGKMLLGYVMAGVNLWKIKHSVGKTRWILRAVNPIIFHSFPAEQCQTGQFSCGSGRCIPESWRCDGDNDCGDMSDESTSCGKLLTSCLLLGNKCAFFYLFFALALLRFYQS